jgi:hypothetical protein
MLTRQPEEPVRELAQTNKGRKWRYKNAKIQGKLSRIADAGQVWIYNHAECDTIL